MNILKQFMRGSKNSMSKNKCKGQMNIFDFIEKDSTLSYWDNDINEIVKRLKELAETYNLEVKNEDFKIWDYVNHLGYRLWVDLKGTRTKLFREDFQNDIEKLVTYAKSRNVELTPMWGACWFFTDDENEIGTLYLSTMFMDKHRRRRK